MSLTGQKTRTFYYIICTDIDLDCEYGYGRYYHKIYLFDGLPNTESLHNGEYIATIFGGNIITNSKNLNHTSRSNVVSVFLTIYDYGDYDYYDYYYHDYTDYYETKMKKPRKPRKLKKLRKQKKIKKLSKSKCSDYYQESSFRGFRLDWKLLK